MNWHNSHAQAYKRQLHTMEVPGSSLEEVDASFKTTSAPKPWGDKHAEPEDDTIPGTEAEAAAMLRGEHLDPEASPTTTATAVETSEVEATETDEVDDATGGSPRSSAGEPQVASMDPYTIVDSVDPRCSCGHGCVC